MGETWINARIGRRTLISRLLRTSGALALGVGLPSGVVTSGYAGAAKKDTVVAALGAPGNVADPHQLTELQHAVRHIYEPLVVRDDELKLKPNLAVGWEIVDPKTWKFTLRKDVKFHNGEKFTAEAVKFSLERIVNPDTKSPQAAYLAPLEKVDIVDDYTVLIRTKTPFGALLPNLSYTGHMLPASYAKLDLKTIGEKATGTGPFKLVEFKKGEAWTMEANMDYWGTKPKVNKVVFKEIKEANTRMAALRAGEADVINGISPDQEEALARDPNVVISRKGPAVMTRYLLFNNGRKPFDDKRVRQATFMATDREGLAKTVLRGRGMVGKAPISPAVFGHNPNLKPWPYDPERAKKMLAEAGYPNGFTVTLMQWAGNLYTADDLVAQALIEQLGNVGITVKLDVKEVQTGVAMLIAHNYDFNIAAWVPMTADGDQALFSPYRSIPGGNRSFYKNEEVDRLLDEGRASPDQTQREKVYLRAQELLWEDVPYAWLFHDVEALAMRKNLKGVVARPDNMVRLFEAAIE